MLIPYIYFDNVHEHLKRKWVWSYNNRGYGALPLLREMVNHNVVSSALA